MAYRLALREGMVVHRTYPLNCETSVPALIGGEVMPNAHFYVRNHFRVPAIDSCTWSLEVTGLVERRLMLSLSDLDRLPSETRAVTLECAGNGRRFLTPAVDGEPWGLGAVSWHGVASVKWLSAIELTDHPFAGYFQTTKYRYEVEGTAEPVTLQRVKALITEPTEGADLPPGETVIRGVAWSGAGAIANAQVSIDGDGWQDARLLGERSRHSWQRWESSHTGSKHHGLIEV